MAPPCVQKCCRKIWQKCCKNKTSVEMMQKENISKNAAEKKTSAKCCRMMSLHKLSVSGNAHLNKPRILDFHEKCSNIIFTSMQNTKKWAWLCFKSTLVYLINVLHILFFFENFLLIWNFLIPPLQTFKL